MKITYRRIKDIVTRRCGKECTDILKILYKEKNISDFVLAEKLKINMKKCRIMLYRMYEIGIVDYYKKLDRKKMYRVSYWNLESKNIELAENKFIKLRIEKLKNRLETELNSIFYICKKGCCRLDFDEAFMNNYKCLECSKILIPEENKKTVNNLSMELKQTIC